MLSLPSPSERGGGRIVVAGASNPGFIQSFKEYLWKLDPWRLYNHADPAADMMLGRGIVSHADLVATEFYNDWMRPQGFLDSFAVNLAPGTLESAVAAFRGPGSDYDEEDLKLVRALTPHLRQAVAVNRRLHRAAREADVLAEGLDHFATGVLVLDASGRVLRSNRAADRMLACKDGLSLCHNELAAARPADARALRQLIGSAAKIRNGHGVGAGGRIAIERPSGRRPLMLLVSPVRSVGADEVDGRAAVLVFVVDPEQSVAPPLEALRRLWGLTCAEARVASLLAAGCHLDDIAERLGVQTNTVRAHLKQVFAKTETRRQADLVLLLLRTLEGCQCERGA